MQLDCIDKGKPWDFSDDAYKKNVQFGGTGGIIFLSDKHVIHFKAGGKIQQPF